MAVLVEGQAEHIRVVPEDLLGPVAVMHIGIDDSDPLVAVFRSQVIDQNGHVVDVAKATVAVHDSHAVVGPVAAPGQRPFRISPFSRASARVSVLPAAIRCASVT